MVFVSNLIIFSHDLISIGSTSDAAATATFDVLARILSWWAFVAHHVQEGFNSNQVIKAR